MSNEQIVSEIQKNHNVEDHLSQLYLQNEPMLQKVARDFLWCGEDIEDLVNVGWIGMQLAVSKYDPEAGALFLTYALYWVRQEIRRHVETCGHLVRLPSFRQEQILRYNKFVNEYRLAYGQDPSDCSICAALEISDQVLRNIRKSIKYQDLDSLERPIPGQEDITLGDTLEGTQNVEEETCDSFLAESIKSQLWAIMDGLEEDQKAAVVENVMYCRTLADIAAEMGVSLQQVGQLRNKAIRNIKKSRAFRKLKHDYDDLYSLGLRGTGLNTFKLTGTSSTEAAALKLLDEEEHQNHLMGLIDDLQIVKLLLIQTQIQRSDRLSYIDLINELVSDPDLRSILIRIVVRGEKASKVIRHYYDDLSRLHESASELKKSIVSSSSSRS